MSNTIKATLTFSRANGGCVTEGYASVELAREAVRRMGGKRVRRAKATPRSLTRYELPGGSQATVAEVVSL